MTKLEFDLPKNRSNIIKVLGVGGGGSNAVSYMYKQGIRDVDFIVCNTDAQALELSPVPTKIQLGITGLGAGSIPEVGREATQEKIDQVKEKLSVNTKMLFITAGMGGGTGTGGAPVIAQAAKELDILTVGIVTMPFKFEGRKRLMQAQDGTEEMRKYVDTLLLINNEKLRELYGNLPLSQAFHQADEVLTSAARSIAEIITVPGYVNVDFEDVKTVMKNSGKAIMGSAMAEGENRATEAAESALRSPLLDDHNIKGANNILLYLASGSKEISMDEVSDITDHVQQEAGQGAEILWGNGSDEALGENICVTIIATGFDSTKKADQTKETTVVGRVGSDNKKDISLEPKKSDPIDQEEIKLVNTKPKNIQKKPENQRVFTFDFESQANVDDQTKSEQNTKPEQPRLEKKEETEAAAEKKSSFASDRKQVKDPDAEPDNTHNNEHQQKAQERILRLQDLSLKLKSPGGLAELEREPAFVRKKMELKDPPPNTGQQTSRYTLSGDDENNTDIRSNNSYLHDNVD